MKQCSTGEQVHQGLLLQGGRGEPSVSQPGSYFLHLGSLVDPFHHLCSEEA